MFELTESIEPIPVFCFPNKVLLSALISLITFKDIATEHCSGGRWEPAPIKQYVILRWVEVLFQEAICAWRRTTIEQEIPSSVAHAVASKPTA